MNSNYFFHFHFFKMDISINVYIIDLMISVCIPKVLLNI